ncbi:MAG TPA: 2-phospho-L-lactate transferase [Candidatus Limnocylindrales bacterium]
MRVVALAGGVGGAKLAQGLQSTVGRDLTVVVNTADDLERHGLLVSPDVDTVMYTLAGLADREQGWGLAGETWNASEMLARYGEETWFRLGDRDLATHLVRSYRVRGGELLADVTLGLAASLGVTATVLPMTNDPVRTQVRTDDGWLDFQDYFVRLRQEPVVHEVRFAGIERAGVPARARGELGSAEIVVIAPSNPIVSIGPILAVPGMRELLAAARRGGSPVVAVSPIVGGRALKGPADRMLASLGHEATALGVARLYEGIVDLFVVDRVDAGLAPEIEGLGMKVLVTDTVMTDDASRARLAGGVLESAAQLRA